jgi:hypothetical protein
MASLLVYRTVNIALERISHRAPGSLHLAINIITDWRPRMPRELSSFLIAVSIIVGLFLFVPCIESIANLLRRRALREKAQPIDAPSTNEQESATGFSREIA